MFNTTVSKTLRGLGLMTTFMFASLAVNAQEKAQILFTAGGGEFGNPSSYIKFYNIQLGDGSFSKTLVDSVPGQFTKAATSRGKEVYFNAGDVLYHFDNAGTQLLDSVTLPGVFDLEVNEKFLVVSRWYPATSNFIQVLDRNTLATLYTSAYATEEAHGIAILRDTAYVAIGSSDSGRVEIISLSGSTPQYVNTLNLDTLGIGADEVYTDSQRIYILSSRDSGWPNYDFISANIFIYDPISQPLTAKAQSAGISGIGYRNNKLYGDFGGLVDAYDLSNDNISNLGSILYNSGALDPVDGDLYLLKGNYVNKDTLFVLAANGSLKNTTSLLPAMDALAVLVYDNSTSGVSNRNALQVQCYPNPAQGNFYLQSNEAGTFSLINLSGQVVLSSNVATGTQNIDIQHLPAGIYQLTFEAASGQYFHLKLIQF